MSFCCTVSTNKEVRQVVPEGKLLTITYITLIEDNDLTDRISLLVFSESGTVFSNGMEICRFSSKNKITSIVTQVICTADLKFILFRLLADGKHYTKPKAQPRVNIFGYWGIPQLSVQVNPIDEHEKSRKFRACEGSDELSSNVSSSKKRRLKASESVEGTAPTKLSAGSDSNKDEQPRKVKQTSDDACNPMAAITVVASAFVNNPPKPLGKWDVAPRGDRGFPVLRPKSRLAYGGIQITDHVIGKGVVPPAGCKVNILYECYLPDGTLLESHADAGRPVVFFKGTSQIMKGIDYGIENMRMGGAREIIIPYEMA